MSAPPPKPKIYHITHLDNLPQMVDGFIWSDADRMRLGFNCKVVGMGEIKRRRLEELTNGCHPRTKVGEYVPFYFCFRSIMLYLLHKGNHPGVTYRGGQKPIVHLEADLRSVVDWAEAHGRRWAFTGGNAGSPYTPFFKDLDQLPLLDWNAIAANTWNDPFVKDRKQSEFLVECSFPWELIERVGVMDRHTAQSVVSALTGARHQPEIVIARHWYY